jgi:hypothetical protein
LPGVADGEVGELVLEVGEASGALRVAGFEEGGDGFGAADLGNGVDSLDWESKARGAERRFDHLAAPIALGDDPVGLPPFDGAGGLPS